VSAVPVVELSDRVVGAVNAARAAKSDENVVAELAATLKELDDVKNRLSALVDVLPELPVSTNSNPDLERSQQLLVSLRAAAALDAVGAARSDDGRSLNAALRKGVSELAEDATEAWGELRTSLRADVRTDFLRRLSALPGFSLAASLLSDNFIVHEAVASGRLPDAAKVREVEAARKRVDEGLAELQALLPEPIRRPLERCFRGELRLMDVSDDFLEWIREHDLEDAFRVEAS